MQQNGLATVREAPPPPVKEDAPAKGPGRGSLTEVEGRATGGVVHWPVMQCCCKASYNQQCIREAVQHLLQGAAAMPARTGTVSLAGRVLQELGYARLLYLLIGSGIPACRHMLLTAACSAYGSWPCHCPKLS